MAIVPQKELSTICRLEKSAASVNEPRMLYLLNSAPQPSKQEDVKNTLVEFCTWIHDLKASGLGNLTVSQQALAGFLKD